MVGKAHKFLGRVRAPRVQLQYDVTRGNAQKTIKLPFVMGVMADLSGESQVEPLEVAKREFAEVNASTFTLNKKMEAMKPRVTFTVPNALTGEGNLAIDLTFEKMEDFEPASVASKVDALKKLLEARTRLANLTRYMSGQSGAEALLQKMIDDPGVLKSLADSTVVPDSKA